MKKLSILLTIWALTAQAQQPIKLSLAQSSTLSSVTLTANQVFDFSDTDRSIQITFIPTVGVPVRLDNTQVKNLLQAGRSFTLADFKVPNPENTQIPANTNQIKIDVQNTDAVPAAPVVAAAIYTPSDYIITDALKLAEFIKADDKPNIKVILERYSVTQSEVENDPFLQSLNIKAEAPTSETGKELEINNFNNVNTPQSNFLSPTAVADALGTFIAKRFKEEINIAYLEKFKKFLKEQEAYRTILPQTYDVLRNKEPYQYTVFLQALHEAFDEDMKVLPGNGLTFLESFDISKTPKIDSNIFYSSLAILRTVEQAHTKNIAIALGQIENLPTVSRLDPLLPVRNVLKLTGLLARNLRISDEDFVKESQLKEYFENDKAVSCFLGLLRQTEEKNLKNIFIDRTNNLYDKITNSGSLIKKIQTEFKQISENIQRVRNAKIPTDEEKKGEKLKFLIDKVEPAIQILKNLSNISKAVGLSIPPQANTYIAAAEYSLSISRNVIEKDYSLAFNGFYSLIDTLGLVKNSDSEVVQALLKYGLFAANVAEAETGAEMLQALETAALPVGSYRIKRNNFFNASINSFGGGSIGGEWFNRETKIFGSPSAPVGLYLGRGTSQNEVKDSDGKSDGVFLSLLDVGAVFALRLFDPNTTTLPEISWKNIFTPGIYYVHGIKKSPFSWGLGIQKAPELRFSASGNQISIVDRNAWRVGFKFTVDIPLFNVYTKANNGSKFRY